MINVITELAPPATWQTVTPTSWCWQHISIQCSLLQQSRSQLL